MRKKVDQRRSVNNVKESLHERKSINNYNQDDDDDDDVMMIMTDKNWIADPDVIWTRNLLIWSQTRYHCATESTTEDIVH